MKTQITNNWKIIKKNGGVLNLLTTRVDGIIDRYTAVLTPPKKGVWKELGISEVKV